MAEGHHHIKAVRALMTNQKPNIKLFQLCHTYATSFLNDTQFSYRIKLELYLWIAKTFQAQG